MIASITGTLQENSLTEIVVAVNGVGYALIVPLSTVDKLPPLQSTVRLFTHLQVREDSLQLYGFITAAERQLFRLLINTVPGIGPKLALNVLSTLSCAAFSSAVANRDFKILSSINGVGKKTAERMIVELRDKVSNLSAGVGPGAISPPTADDAHPAALDALAALETLGYKKDVAGKAVQRFCAEDTSQSLSASALIKKVLQQLNS